MPPQVQQPGRCVFRICQWLSLWIHGGRDMRTSFLRLLPSVAECSCHIRVTLFLPFRSQVCFGTFHRSGQDYFRPDLCFEALPIQSCLPSFLHECQCCNIVLRLILLTLTLPSILHQTFPDESLVYPVLSWHLVFGDLKLRYQVFFFFQDTYSQFVSLLNTHVLFCRFFFLDVFQFCSEAPMQNKNLPGLSEQCR